MPDSIIRQCMNKTVTCNAGVYGLTRLICSHHALCKCQSSNTEQGGKDKDKKKSSAQDCSAVEACQNFFPQLGDFFSSPHPLSLTVVT